MGDVVNGLLGSTKLDKPDATTELPYTDGKFRPVLKKWINSLTDLEVYTPHLDARIDLADITEERENFYNGNAVSQMNLFYRNDIERTLEPNLLVRIDACLQRLSEWREVEQYTETIILKYYPHGSGATTLGRLLLWKEKEEYRCAVLKKIGEKTGQQISELQKILYKALGTSPLHIPPVLIFVDRISDEQDRQLSEELNDNKTKCVLLKTILLDEPTEDDSGDLILGKLDDTEIKRVRGILCFFPKERAERADEKLQSEKSFKCLESV